MVSPLHQSVISAFQSMGWEFQPVQGREVVETRFEAGNTRVFVHAQSEAAAGIVTVVSRAGVQMPRSHKWICAELLMRVNEQLMLGNLEMQWDSGEVMFRASAVYPPGEKANERVVASLVHSAVAEMDRLTPFLIELMRVGELELPLFSVQDLLEREDLQGEGAA
jgi:hypothetical protein